MGHARIRGSRGWVTARGHPALWSSIGGRRRRLLVPSMRKTGSPYEAATTIQTSTEEWLRTSPRGW